MNENLKILYGFNDENFTATSLHDLIHDESEDEDVTSTGIIGREYFKAIFKKVPHAEAFNTLIDNVFENFRESLTEYFTEEDIYIQKNFWEFETEIKTKKDSFKTMVAKWIEESNITGIVYELDKIEKNVITNTDYGDYLIIYSKLNIEMYEK